MIDFRYHLVSIVSIFLALAVGIVLGAGPLKEDLGNTLSDQVTQLRDDRNNLRTQLDAAQAGIVGRDAFVTAVNPTLVKDALAGRTVALVVTPDTSGDLVTDTREALVSAGATVGSTVTLSDDWADPAKVADRTAAVTPLAPLVGVPTVTGDANALASAVLAASILATAAVERPADGATEALDGLADADLVQVTPSPIVPATSAVLVSGTVEETDTTVRDAELASYVALAEALDAAGSGAVVTAPSDAADPDTSVGVVAAVRADTDAAKAVSTVDDGDLPMGLSTTVLALRDQYDGSVGHYGMAGGATGIVPEPTATATATDTATATATAPATR